MEGVPRYVAIIIDGNGRWAERRGVSVSEGHRAGAENLMARLRDAAELGVEELTAYALSTENWSRAPEEVDALVGLVRAYVERETRRLHEAGVRIRFAGRRDGGRIPVEMRERMEWAERLTEHNSGMTFCVPFDYGGRAEIVDAARTFTGTTEEEFRRHLYTPELHDPDVVIRTGGEHRLSNFLLWQTAYSELVVRDELWPDFDRDALEAAFAEYAARSRRYGGREASPAAPARARSSALRVPLDEPSAR